MADDPLERWGLSPRIRKKDGWIILKRPIALWILIFWMLVLALGGLYGGITMLIDPSGDLLGVADVLRSAPVSDLVLPGLFLFLVMGLLPLVLVYALLARPDWKWLESLLRRTKHHWAWNGTIVLVVILAIWLVVEGMMIGFEWAIQYLTAVNGLLVLVVALLPSVRTFYRKR